MDARSSRLARVTLHGADDPGGRRAGAVMTAYVNAERAHGFRRLLVRRLSAAALAACAIAATTSLVTPRALAATLLALGLAAAFGVVVERRAAKALDDAIASLE